MKMYVGNATAQDHVFIYRIPEESQQRQIPIRRMSQIVLPDKNLSQMAVDSIIEQHGRYGFVSSDEAKRSRIYTGLIYSVDKPVTGVMLEFMFSMNRGVLDERGKVIRQETAIAANAKITEQLEAQKAEGLDAAVVDVDMTIQEEEQRGGGFVSQAEGAKVVSEGYRVDNKAQPRSAPHKPGKRKATR